MKYKSMYSDSKVSASQYISELVCFNNAQKRKIELPLKFWNAPHWKSFYIVQIKAANKLLESFDEKHIISYIRTKKIYSLSADWIENDLKENKSNNYNKIYKKDFKEIKVNKDPSFRRKKDKDIDF